MKVITETYFTESMSDEGYYRNPSEKGLQFRI